MIKILMRLIAGLWFSVGVAFAATNPAPSHDEEFQKIVDRIVAEGAQDGCSEQVVWL